MFHNLLQAVTRRPPAEFDGGFVEAVRTVTRERDRNPRAEKLMAICWAVIVVKCVLVTWLVHHYQMNFSPLWVTAPTVFFALMCTAAYVCRE